MRSGTRTCRRRSWPPPPWRVRSSGRCATESRTSTRATWRRSGSNAGATTQRCSSASWRQGAETMDNVQLLAALAGAIRGGGIRIVDLTQTLSPDFPQIALPPEMGQCWAFRIEEISQYDARGPGWYWSNFSCGEHTGTHFDAPIHWISGRDLPNNSVDTIPVQSMVAPACVIDCSAQARADPDYLLTVDDIERWEARH